MPPAEQKWRVWIQLILGLAITALFFYMMAPFLVALFLGAVTAILCYPIFTSLKRKLPRPLAGILVTAGVTLGILLPLVFVLVSGAYKLLGLVRGIRLPRDGQLENLLHHPTSNKIMLAISRLAPVDRDWLRSHAIDLVQLILEKVSAAVAGFIGNLPGLMLAFAVLIISVYFLTVDGARLLRFLSTLSPMKRDRSLELYHAFEKSCRGVVLGMFASSLLQGILVTFFFLVSGLPNAFLMGVTAVVMGMVPVVGTAPITVGAFGYLFSVGELAPTIFMGIGMVIIGTADNIVRPWVMKGQSEMHPLLALVSAFGAINLMGATGIFLGPIIAAVFVSFLHLISSEIRREEHAAQHRKSTPPPDPDRL